MKMRILSSFVCCALVVNLSECFLLDNSKGSVVRKQSPYHQVFRRTSHIRYLSESSSEEWNGEVVSNAGDNGRILGCSITKVDGSQTDYEVSIDGVEADLGKFSEAIYKKITSDAKQQRFQGFRPGTIPPHLLPTYVSFAMDECAREATLEALEQNDIRPFEATRMEMTFDTVSIPPAAKKSKKKKGGRKNKKKKNASPDNTEPVVEIVEEPQWRSFDTMKEAIDAGWKVSQFSNRTYSQQQINPNLKIKILLYCNKTKNLTIARIHFLYLNNFTIL